MVFLSLGSNLGDRRSNLSIASRELRNVLDRQLWFSPVIETQAVGFDGNPFLNQAVAFESSGQGDSFELEPFMLLSICRAIEVRMGRPEHSARFNESGARLYENRIIDIDILSFDDVRIDSIDLKLPHPQVYEREYVMQMINSFSADIRERFDI